MTTPRVKFENVSKIYRLGDSSRSVRAAFASIQDRLLKKDHHNGVNLVALNQANFEIGSGESVGLIGPNGSGKTTALKLISNITRCNSGNVYVNGKVSALIELGAGFHPDLTGRENIYFNAAILGMKNVEIQKRFNAIVDFSGLEPFLDTPVKRYSSGMYCRLGFAVAVFVNPDILLIDEVLAVGDVAFQNKSLKRMNELRVAGTTIIFVTHNLGYLQRLCSRAIFLFKGDTIMDGPVDQVIQAYRDHDSYRTGGNDSLSKNRYSENEEAKEDLPDSSQEAQIADIYFTDASQQRTDRIQTGSSLDIHIVFNIIQPINNINFEVWFYGMDGAEYATFRKDWISITGSPLSRQGEVKLSIDQLCLMPGTYFVNIALSDMSKLNNYDVHWERHRLIVLSGPMSQGLFYQPHKWLLSPHP